MGDDRLDSEPWSYAVVVGLGPVMFRLLGSHGEVLRVEKVTEIHWSGNQVGIGKWRFYAAGFASDPVTVSARAVAVMTTPSEEMVRQVEEMWGERLIHTPGNGAGPLFVLPKEGG